MAKKTEMNQQIRLLHAVAAFIGVVLSTIILLYLNKLEQLGCECAYDWRRNYIMMYAVVMIVYGIMDLYGVLSGNATVNQWVKTLVPVTWIAGILFAIFGIQYVHYLQKEKCSCSAEIGRDVLYIVAIVDAIFFSLLGIMMLVSWARYAVGAH